MFFKVKIVPDTGADDVDYPPVKEVTSKISPKPACEVADNVKKDIGEKEKPVHDKLVEPTAVHEVSISIVPKVMSDYNLDTSYMYL